MSGPRIAFAAAASLFLAGVIVQVFLAGLGAFKITDWTTHTGLGWLLGSIPLFVLLPLAFVAGSPNRTRWLTVALVVSAGLQPELASARAEAPVIAALHPVNAMLVFWLAWLVARASLQDARQPAMPVSPAPSTPPASPPDAAP